MCSEFVNTSFQIASQTSMENGVFSIYEHDLSGSGGVTELGTESFQVLT